MKIILSRKGFDSTNGGCPSPIMPDGTLLSMPIPSNDADKYENLSINGISYSELLKQIRPTKAFSHCHVDPDIRPGLRSNTVPGWKPAFGQIGAAQGLLANAGIELGDLFLFFGWFRRVELGPDGYHFVRKSTEHPGLDADLHVIYGYLQVGEIITDPDEITKYHWHPHASTERLNNKTNALYLPARNLSWDKNREGYEALEFHEKRVLTMPGCKRGTWTPLPFTMPEHVYGHKKNSAVGSGLYYSGVWQELVIYESEGLEEWAKEIIKAD